MMDVLDTLDIIVGSIVMLGESRHWILESMVSIISSEHHHRAMLFSSYYAVNEL